MEFSDIPLLDEISRNAQEKLLLAQVGQEIQSNLQHIEQVLDSFFRDTARRDDLPGLKPFLKQVYGALKILELEPAVQLLDECESLIDGFSQPGYEPQQEQLEQVAEGLSSLGFYVESVQRGRTDAVQIIDETMARLKPEAAPVATTMEQQEQESADSPATLHIDHPPEEIEDSASVEAGLDEQKHRVQALLQQWQQNPEDGQARGALHQQLTALLQDADLVADNELKALTSEAKRLLEESATPTAELAAAAAALVAPKVAAVTPSAETARLAQETDETVDAEMLEIFLEEADEVLASVSENLAICHAQPSNKDALTTLRRSFHTLKGSGRMVGLWDLGEVAWGIEQLMNKWLQDEKHATPELLAVLGDAYEHFSGWVSGLKSDGAVKIQADDLLARAERLKTGAAAVPAANIAEPAPEIEPQQAAEETPITPELAEAIPEDIPAPADDAEQEIAISLPSEPEEVELTSLLAVEDTAEAPPPDEAITLELPSDEPLPLVEISTEEAPADAESEEETAPALPEIALELDQEAQEIIEPGHEEAPLDTPIEDVSAETVEAEHRT